MEENKKRAEEKIIQEAQKEQQKSGEIRYRLDQKSKIKGGLFQFVTLFMVVVFTSLVTSTYVTQRIQETPITIDGNSDFSEVLKKSLESFESTFYDRVRIRDLYKSIAPSLVGVSNDPDRFFQDAYEGVYTGVVMNTEGYILVPYDLVERSETEIFVRSGRDNDRIYRGELIGKDAALGVALIRAENINLRPPKFADSSTVKVAQSVIAMGSPFGDIDRGTVTFGVVSTVNKAFPTLAYDNREVRIYAIETDATLNPGNHGGVLVNMNGEVVGINSLRLSETMGLGLGAAITSNEARSITRSMINTGEDLVPFIGIFGDIVTDLEEVGTGFYVQRIAPEGTADRAGLRPTDIILSIDEELIEDRLTIDEYIKTKRVGDVVVLRFQRMNEVLEVEATLYGTTVD